MKFREWLEELEYDVISGNLDIEVEDVIYDSRKARENVVFVCTKGTKIDSHEVIPDVVKAGGKHPAVARQAEIPAGVPAIRVLRAGAARATRSQGLPARRRGWRPRAKPDPPATARTGAHAASNPPSAATATNPCPNRARSRCLPTSWSARPGQAPVRIQPYQLRGVAIGQKRRGDAR